ncbi:hypothetical protein EPUL_006829 [Erysiphe pulchra]|uniref:Uncharacterized protein n=1 Tax=Erysiphe pulchra TaxID=225359 RepID=A0A2S4PJY8_9PEZI|nr:hypothetical protein EPUL_006829 [Erysiphe pulchra]
MANGLLDYKMQETFYTRIVERYMAFCSDASQGDELIRRLARMSLSTAIREPHSELTDKSEKEIGILIMAMRKLREGIIASRRIDDFSIQAFIFSIRLSISVKHMESFHPAILHLLKRMHPVQPLASTERQELVSYLVLDLACRQDELAEAFFVRNQYQIRDPKIDAILKALAHDNYVLFWKVKRTVDGHRAKLMEFSEDAMRKHTLKCLGRSYLKMDLSSVENYTQTTWHSLTQHFGVGWQLEDGNVNIRKRKT